MNGAALYNKSLNTFATLMHDDNFEFCILGQTATLIELRETAGTWVPKLGQVKWLVNS